MMPAALVLSKRDAHDGAVGVGQQRARLADFAKFICKWLGFVQYLNDSCRISDPK